MSVCVEGVVAHLRTPATVPARGAGRGDPRDSAVLHRDVSTATRLMMCIMCLRGGSVPWFRRPWRAGLPGCLSACLFLGCLWSSTVPAPPALSGLCRAVPVDGTSRRRVRRRARHHDGTHRLRPRWHREIGTCGATGSHPAWIPPPGGAAPRLRPAPTAPSSRLLPLAPAGRPAPAGPSDRPPPLGGWQGPRTAVLRSGGYPACSEMNRVTTASICWECPVRRCPPSSRMRVVSRG